MKGLENEWLDFKLLVLDQQAEPLDENAAKFLRMVFYAGSKAAIDISVRIGIEVEDGDITPEDGHEQLGAVREELDQFFDRMLGRIENEH